MKNIIYILIAMISLSSCTTTEKMTVYATPGTRIFTSLEDKNPKVVSSSGSVKIEVPSDGYYAYMLAQEPNNNFLVPFGIDCKGNKHIGTKALYLTGAAIMSAGVGGLVAGGAAYIGGDKDFGNIALLSGVGAMSLGAAIGTPAKWRLDQKAYDYNFTYKKHQHVDKDLHLLPLMNVDPEKNSSKIETTTAPKRSKATVGNTSKSDKPNTSKVKKGLRDYGQAVEGSYVGAGKIYKGKNLEESYDNIRIEIRRISNVNAEVVIYESDEEFFSSPLSYDISKNKDGSYLLKMKDIPSAIIKIDSKGNLTFSHDKVNIDDEVYKLVINGKKVTF